MESSLTPIRSDRSRVSVAAPSTTTPSANLHRRGPPKRGCLPVEGDSGGARIYSGAPSQRRHARCGLDACTPLPRRQYVNLYLAAVFTTSVGNGSYEFGRFGAVGSKLIMPRSPVVFGLATSSAPWICLLFSSSVISSRHVAPCDRFGKRVLVAAPTISIRHGHETPKRLGQ